MMIAARGIALGVACGLAFSGSALAAAAEECLPAGDAAAVLKCLTDEEIKTNAELATLETTAANHARNIEQATGRVGAHAALAKSVRDFAQYRASQCAYVKELIASGTGSAQAQMGCRVDLTRRRIRELKP
jgi:uncharacterized protein YecT (DUF1311 family)